MAEPVPERDLSGTVIERYRLLRRLGQGGMGTVYEAQHEHLDRRVAIKVLAERLAQEETSRRRFLREARAASRVHHPGIIEISDVGFAGELVFFVMEHLQGQDLAERLEARGTLPWAEAQPILVQITAALTAAHEAGVIHRDIKPSNCFLVDDPRGGPPRVKVLDFGIAKVISTIPDQVTALTTTGQWFGTVAYMPPEISRGISDDPRSDLYSLGVMIFQLLTGRLPFVGSAVEVIAQHITRPAPPMRSLEPSIPEAVDELVAKALRKDPEDRQASMRELDAALRAVGPPRTERSVAPAAPRARAGTPRREGAGARVSTPPSMSRAQLVDLDELPPRQDVVISPERSLERGWTSAYAQEPEPELPPMPGTTAASLELDLPEGWVPGQTVQDPPARAPRSFRVPWRPVLGLGVLVALGVGGWMLLGRETGSLPRSVDEGLEAIEGGLGLEDEPEVVLLLVDTTPKGAKVYVDDLLTSARPIRVPRSEEYLRVRVEAEGYEPRTIQVQPVATRRLEVVLDRARRRRR